MTALKPLHRPRCGGIACTIRVQTDQANLNRPARLFFSKFEGNKKPRQWRGFLLKATLRVGQRRPPAGGGVSKMNSPRRFLPQAASS
ncbi:MAG: hypothetical protein RIS24_1324 [Verrucomicrobiota bacterium]|jgi:hypothetical protein